MRMTEEFCSYCPHCGKRVEIDGEHKCFADDRRQTALLLEYAIDTADNPMQLLWLIRIAHRLRQTLNGLEKYRERAELARRVIGLMEVKR
jgi:hypothetical protein